MTAKLGTFARRSSGQQDLPFSVWAQRCTPLRRSAPEKAANRLNAAKKLGWLDKRLSQTPTCEPASGSAFSLQPERGHDRHG